jgi:hypothetical protein
MNISDLLSAARRHMVLTVVLVTFAVGLALFSYTRIGWDSGGLSLSRRGEAWLAETRLLVTQPGFPYGRAVPEFFPSNARTGAPAVALGDQDRLAQLSSLYAQLATSDAVRSSALKDGPLFAKIEATPVTFAPGGYASPQVLPIVAIHATASEPQVARNASIRIALAFEGYVLGRQKSAKIPQSQRINVDVITADVDPKLVAGAPKALPAVVLFAALVLSAMALTLVDRRTARRRTQVPSVQEAPAERAKIAIAERPEGLETGAVAQADGEEPAKVVEAVRSARDVRIRRTR